MKSFITMRSGLPIFTLDFINVLKPLNNSLRKHAHAINRNFIGIKNLKFHQKCFDSYFFAHNVCCGAKIRTRGPMVL